MNPSSSGWIKKHLSYTIGTLSKTGPEDYYQKFREVGFIYGTSVATLVPIAHQKLDWTEIEKTKINLIDALVGSYFQRTENTSKEDCVSAINSFYNHINAKKTDEKPIANKIPYEILERIVNQRIQTNESLIKKNFSHILTNALLFVDVLAFAYFLNTHKDPQAYAIRLEEILTKTVFFALQSKEDKSEYDDLLVKLLVSSVRYTTISSHDNINFDPMDLEGFREPLERRYILDLTCLAVWNDYQLDQSGSHFVQKLGAALKLEATLVNNSVNYVHEFIAKHESELSFFHYSNPIQHFYKQTVRTVNVLILRNKNRLLKELSQSKELAILLGQSTYRDLSNEEKILVKKQLIDICKTIPSLAIFILPGGSLLLPLLIKFIPKLLPSAFNENKI